MSFFRVNQSLKNKSNWLWLSPKSFFRRRVTGCAIGECMDEMQGANDEQAEGTFGVCWSEVRSPSMNPIADCRLPTDTNKGRLVIKIKGNWSPLGDLLRCLPPRFPPTYLMYASGSLVVGALHLIHAFTKGETSYPLRKKLLGGDQLQ